jgi:hypothetical protein
MGREEWSATVSQSLEQLFPSLTGSRYEITSPAENGYNCIAWAVGDTSLWWWPDEFDQYYWPEGVPRSSTLDAFVQAFQVLGFDVCGSGAIEEGWEKVAIFANRDGVPTHAARQLADGTWTSKLGRLEDIQHSAVDDVSGSCYGDPRVFLRRRRRTSSPARSEGES